MQIEGTDKINIHNSTTIVQTVVVVLESNEKLKSSHKNSIKLLKHSQNIFGYLVFSPRFVNEVEWREGLQPEKEKYERAS